MAVNNREKESQTTGQNIDFASLLQSLTPAKDSKSREVREINDRQAYEDRLLSFNPVTYCAKPACLSPMICAGLGWRNADEKDLLSCSYCNEAIMIAVNQSLLSVRSVEKLCNTYRQQLAIRHNSRTCPFYLTAEQFGALDKPEHDIPTYMATKLPPDSVKLIEHPRPSSILRNQIQVLDNACKNIKVASEGSQQQWHFPTNLKLPSEILEYQMKPTKVGDDDDDNHASRGKNLFADIANFLGAKNVSTTILAMMGWIVIDDDINEIKDQNGNGTPTISLGCPVCLSMMELALEDETGASEEQPPPTKRPRVHTTRQCNPVDSHRYYCPIVCGFPRTLSSSTSDGDGFDEIPVWQLLLTRVHQEKFANENKAAKSNDENKAEDELKEDAATEDDGDLEFARIQKILRMGIAPKTVVLDEDEDEEAILKSLNESSG